MGRESSRNRGRVSTAKLGIFKITSLAVIAIMILSSLAIVSNAAVCGTLPSGISTLINACYPANIVSTGGTTPAGFQQQFSNVPFNALAGNFVVYNGLSGALMNTWVENSTVVWSNLESNTFAVANGVYYFGFCSSCNFFIKGNDIGEAPELSASYAQYDNGAQIFPALYDNFYGKTLNSIWTGSQGTAVSNGVTETGSNALSGFYSVGTYNLQTNTIDALAKPSQTGINDYYPIWLSTAPGIAADPRWTTVIEGAGNTQWVGYTYTGTQYYTPNLGAATASAFQVLSAYQDGSAYYASFNYGAFGSQTNNYAALTAAYVSQDLYSGGATMITQWIRLRTTPPGGVMPSVTYQPLQAITSSTNIILTIQNNPMLLHTNNLVTATSNVPGDTTNIIIDGVQVTPIIPVQPDVLVQYSNGLVVGYNATTATPQARGLLLKSVAANAVTGESIYLTSETYNMIANGIQLPINGNLYGAGKFQTVITSNYPYSATQGIVNTGTNSIVADLGIIEQGWHLGSSFPTGNGYGVPITGGPGGINGNVVIRNIYTNAQGDGIDNGYYVFGNLSIYNVTILSNFDGMNFEGAGIGKTSISVFDSNIMVANAALVAQPGVGRGISFYGFQTGTNEIETVVNTIISVGGGGTEDAGISMFYEPGNYVMTTNVFGGKITTFNSPVANDLYIFPVTSNAIYYVNSTLSYNSLRTTGTVNTVALGSTPYGAYPYQRSPMTVPGGPWSSMATYNAVGLALGSHSVIGCDQTANSCASPQTLNVVSYILESASGAATAYETSSQLFSYSIAVSPAYASANVNMQVYNGVSTTNNLWSNQTVTGSPQTFSFSYPIPLLASNAVTYTFNAVLFSRSPWTNLGVANTITQTELFNYYPSATLLNPANPSNVLLGMNLTYNTVIAQVYPLNAATIAGYIQLGTGQMSELLVGQYTYWGNVLSFVPSSYGLKMPKLGTPVNVIANSVVQLSFNGNSVYRDVNGINLQIYNESLEPCGGAYTTNGINWQFWDITTITPWPTNVFAQGFFTPQINGYTGNAQSADNVGFAAQPATGNTYATCIYPSWGVFNISGTLQYNASGSLVSSYIINGRMVSNTLSTQRLYLESQPAPVAYDIYTLNQQSQVYQASQVKVYSYYIGNDTSILLSQLQIPAQSGAPIMLQAGSQYTFAAYSPNGQTFYATQGPLTAAQCSSSPCSYTIYLNNVNITNPQSVFGDITTSCAGTTTGANQITLSCIYTSKSGTSYNMQLYGYNNGPIQGSPICLNQVTAASGVVSCVFNNVQSTEYLWQLKLNQSGAYQNMNYGTVGVQASQYGTDAVWFAFLVIMTLAFLFMTRSVVIAVILFDIGWTVTSFIGLISVTTYTVPFLWVLSAVLLYLLNRK